MKTKILFYLPGLIILYFNYKLAIVYSMVVSLFFLLNDKYNFLKK